MGFFQFKPTPSVFPPSLSFTGQTVLITGGTSGLGLETAIHYVQLGASPVIITARNAARGATAVATIEARTARKGIVQVRILDMDSFSDIKRFVDALEKEVKTIDIVLLNAGCIYFDYEKSPEGWEYGLQVNVLSTTLLGLLLLPYMQAAKQAGRIQHLGLVGSGSHTGVDILANEFPKRDVLKYWNKEKNYPGGRSSYAISKLLVQYAVREISKLAIGPGESPSPIVNVVCPGPVQTNLSRHFASKSVAHKAMVAAYGFRSHTPEVGARALVIAATTSPAEHGKFIRPYMADAEYDRCAAKNITNKAGKEMQSIVWKEILQVLEAAVPEVKRIADPSVDVGIEG